MSSIPYGLKIRDNMSEPATNIAEEIGAVIPQRGFIYDKETSDYILCKPKLMPLKSITLEKLEKMQKEAELKVKEMEKSRQTMSEEEK